MLSATLAASITFVSPAEIVVNAARRQIGVTTAYDPAYRKIAYPGGDVPRSTGVCTDVVIRAYRAAGIDLQRLVHEDMRANFGRYPRNWGLTRPDSNIDHRRVPNLQTFLRRRGKAVSDAYAAGDIVTWRLANGRDHIGVVTVYPRAVHNIGWGAQEESVVNRYAITGHYRYWRIAPASLRR